MFKRDSPTGCAWLSLLTRRWRLFLLTAASVAILTALAGLLLQDQSSPAVPPLVDSQSRQAEQHARQQRMRYQQLLQDAQAERFNLTTKASENMSGVADVDAVHNQKRLRELAVKLDDYDERIAVLTQKRRSLENWVQHQPTSIAHRIEQPNPDKQRLIERKRALQDELFAKRTGPGKPTAEHPDVKRLIDAVADVQGEIETTQDTVEVQTQAVPNAARIDAARHIELMTGELTALQSRRDIVARTVKKLDTNLRDRAAADERTAALTHDVAEYRRQVGLWDTRLRAAQSHMSGAAPYTDSDAIIEMLIVAVVLGAGVGGTVTLGAELRHRGYRSVQDAADRLELPVLGAVDQVAA